MVSKKIIRLPANTVYFFSFQMYLSEYAKDPELVNESHQSLVIDHKKYLTYVYKCITWL